MLCRIMHSFSFSVLIISHSFICYSFLFVILIFKFVFCVFSETVITIVFYYYVKLSGRFTLIFADKFTAD
jgi:hypothetical protein